MTCSGGTAISILVFVGPSEVMFGDLENVPELFDLCSRVLAVKMGRPRKKPVYVDNVECWRCSVCKKVKPTGEFNKASGNTNGLSSCCRDCQKKQNDSYRANPEGLKKARACTRRWNAENPEQFRANCKRAREENKVDRLVYEKTYNEANPEKRWAKSAVQHALEGGQLFKPERCEVNGCIKPLDAHHDSYDRDRWLVVVWMCKRCHRWTHARLRDQADGIW